jgi:DNA polymerase-3 subunit gamma/tau
MRDALSLLDQAIAFSGNKLTLQSVRESVSLVEGETILGILAGILGRKPLDALALVDEAHSKGHDLRVLTRSLIEFLHGAILSKIGATGPATLEQMSEEEWNELSRISQLRSLEEIELIFQVLHHGMEWIARSPQPKIVLDVLLVKCATAEALIYSDPNRDSSAPRSSENRSQPAATPSVATAPLKAMSSPAAIVQPAPQAIAPIAAPVAAPTEARQGSSQTFSWEGFIEHVRKPRPLLATLLEHGTTLTLPSSGENTLAISFNPKDAYFKEQLQSRVYNEQLLTLSKDYFGHPVRVQIELKDEGESLAARKERLQKEREKNARDAAQSHPIIREAKALFGGDLGPIELIDDHS